MLVLLTKGGKVIDQDVIQKVVEFHGRGCPEFRGTSVAAR